MKFVFPNKSINTMLTSVAGLLLVVGSSTSFADSKEAVKAEVEDTKAITKIAEAPTDTGFKTLDGNSDGKISLKEAVKDPVLAEQFNKTDANKDGAITAEEYAMYSSKAEKPTAVN
ncbi:MAG: EF-hand domain-containing protein [Methylophilaceae bacterium]